MSHDAIAIIAGRVISPRSRASTRSSDASASAMPIKTRRPRSDRRAGISRTRDHSHRNGVDVEAYFVYFFFFLSVVVLSSSLMYVESSSHVTFQGRYQCKLLNGPITLASYGEFGVARTSTTFGDVREDLLFRRASGTHTPAGMLTHACSNECT